MTRELKRKSYEIEKKNGQYILQGTPPKGFVASGGGGKGIYYASIVQTMEERDMLKDLTHVSGASAGAMTVSLLAVGINSANFTKLVKDLDITKLLDNEGAFRLRARGVRFRNIMEVIYVQQIKEHLKGVEEPQNPELKEKYHIIKDKIKIFDHILKNAGVKIDSVDDIIALSKNAEALANLDKTFAKSSKNWRLKTTNEKINPRITFSDLENLRAILPEEKQHLIKNLSVTTTNQFTKQKQIHNAEKTAGDSISAIVQQSAAHPLIFSPSKNHLGHSVADGGILDNMPSDVLIDQFELDPEEILCAKVEADSSFKERLDKAKQHAPIVSSAFDRFIDGLTDIVLGGSLFKGRAEVLNREKIYHHLDNMIYLNSRNITAVTTSMSEAQRAEAIEDGLKQCDLFFNSRVKNFDNPLLPMLYLGKEKLDETLDDTVLTEKEYTQELFEAAAYAQIIFFLQSEIVKNANKGHFQDLPFNISQIHTLLIEDAKLNEVQTEQAMALILKQINYQCEGKLEAYLLQEIEAEEDAQKVSFFTILLNLLYKPIEWILSCFPSSPVPVEATTVKPTTDTAPTDSVASGTAPTGTIPTDTIPTDAIPTDAIPTDTAPTDIAATGTAAAGAEPLIQEQVNQYKAYLRPEKDYTARRIYGMFSVQEKLDKKTEPVEDNELQEEEQNNLSHR